MPIIKTEFPGLLIFEPKIWGDERGYFFESYKKSVFRDAIGDVDFVQETESFSKKGVLRGLHYQTAPFAQAKLVRVNVGEVFDVAVDLRADSKSVGRETGEGGLGKGWRSGGWAGR